MTKISKYIFCCLITQTSKLLWAHIATLKIYHSSHFNICLVLFFSFVIQLWMVFLIFFHSNPFRQLCATMASSHSFLLSSLRRLTFSWKICFRHCCSVMFNLTWPENDKYKFKTSYRHCVTSNFPEPKQLLDKTYVYIISHCNSTLFYTHKNNPKSMGLIYCNSSTQVIWHFSD